MLGSAAVTAWILAIIAISAPAFALDAADLVNRLQKSYESVRTVGADFTQEYRSRRFDPRGATGRVVIQKPGRMRWDYAEPKGKVLVMDGEKITLYDPSDRQALVGAQPKDENLPVALAFLWGHGRLKEEFNITLESEKVTGKETTATLKCVPKKPMPNVSEVMLTVRLAEPMVVTATRVRDGFGGENEITFSKIKVNEKTADRFTTYKPPSGVPVVSMDTDEMKF